MIEPVLMPTHLNFTAKNRLTGYINAASAKKCPRYVLKLILPISSSKMQVRIKYPATSKANPIKRFLLPSVTKLIIPVSNIMTVKHIEIEGIYVFKTLCTILSPYLFF
ncbi:MAG: hypothetical protein E7249_11050 [Paenibacillaceae bacterium]|nr:hypothetical protein [Paenibacillaceae bacterium]